MRKKIVGISSSRVNGNTIGKLKEIGEILKKKGYDFEIVHLMKHKVKECIGCETCLRGGECPLNDDAKFIMEKLVKADGIVMSTPVYMFNICGRLKTFADRTCKWFHRTELYGKPILNLATTSGGGLRETEKYMNLLAVEWGAYPSGCVKRNVINLEEKVTEKEIKKFIVNLEKGSEIFKPSLNMLIMFSVQKVLAQKVLKHDEEYWIKKGWIESDYFYKCKINPLNKVLSKAFYKMMYKKVKKSI
ncbi:flavodoxin family protein [Oceanirhabdus sp. W0125-5]|uniref:flavodoxin family protein n=1 Tax=Oceanirhabdus sp. W0125-5 TaxID=2999116 RepID=UPI0022F2FD8B|nr:flavodoxin family protein [Oceanirhabdus sp. W0125-5]WBW98435.1 flavodoxin family protein [Oceanirhabdus sp. W0125-5]